MALEAADWVLLVRFVVGGAVDVAVAVAVAVGALVHHFDTFDQDNPDCFCNFFPSLDSIDLEFFFQHNCCCHSACRNTPVLDLDHPSRNLGLQRRHRRLAIDDGEQFQI